MPDVKTGPRIALGNDAPRSRRGRQSPLVGLKVVGSRVRILIVDDEPEILSALRDYFLHRLKAEVEVARSGPAALRLLPQGYDLLVADYRMPGMSGLELIVEARRAAPATRTVLFTAYKDQALAKRATEAGVDLVLGKDLLPMDVAQRILDLLARP